MNDLPFFTAPDGMASLILREIPRQGTAYVVVRCVFGSQEGLLRDCDSFCRGAGAKDILYSGNADFSGFAAAACLTERSLPRERLPETDAAAVATKDPRWVELYNERFAAIPAARTYHAVPEGAYLVYDGERLIGLGQVSGDEIAAVASLEKGRGRDCLCALAAKTTGPTVRLLCAEENLPAVRLYDGLGFSRDVIRERWYRRK